MGRAGYCDESDDDNAQINYINWRGAVTSALRGKRGQQFLRELLAALNALPEPKLIANELAADGQVCALGAVGRARGLDMSKLDPDDYDTVAGVFGIANAMAREIMFENDEWRDVTPEARFARMKQWVEGCLRPEPDPS